MGPYVRSGVIYFRGVCHDRLSVVRALENSRYFLNLVVQSSVRLLKSTIKLILPDHNLLHNTSNKGKVLPYNTTITPYRYETHIILFRPLFVSSFALATPLLCIFTPLGLIWRFPKTNPYRRAYFRSRIFRVLAK